MAGPQGKLTCEIPVPAPHSTADAYCVAQVVLTSMADFTLHDLGSQSRPDVRESLYNSETKMLYDLIGVDDSSIIQRSRSRWPSREQTPGQIHQLAVQSIEYGHTTGINCGMGIFTAN